jgi:nitric-oxide synthase
VAWRNASRCVGRLYWRSLLVLDQRHVRTPDETFAAMVQHLEIASERSRRAGRHERNHPIRPVISVFPAAVPGRPYAPGLERTAHPVRRLP